MIKVIIIILMLVKLSISTSFAEDKFKIILKINKKIITNVDIKKEKKYLGVLTPQILSLSEKDISELAKQSLIKEITKEDEVLKYFKIDYNSPELLSQSQLVERLNFQNEKEFKDYLSQSNLDLEEVLRKIAIEISWNRLIFEKYKDQVVIDEKKIKNNLDELSKNKKKKKVFFLSEILFTAENKNEYDRKYQKIIKTIEVEGFKNAATIFSISDSSGYGGEIGWVKKSQLSSQVSNVLINLKKDSFSQPIKIPSGFLIIKLNDIKNEILEFDYDLELKKIMNIENNRQLNQFSNIYFKKVQRRSFIDEQ